MVEIDSLRTSPTLIFPYIQLTLKTTQLYVFSFLPLYKFQIQYQIPGDKTPKWANCSVFKLKRCKPMFILFRYVCNISKIPFLSQKCHIFWKFSLKKHKLLRRNILTLLNTAFMRVFRFHYINTSLIWD